MARKHGKDRGILEYPKGSGKWWVRIFINGREKRYRADNKTQAKALYGRLKAEIREGRYFPEKYNQPEAITLRAWIDRCLEGFTHLRGYRNQKRYGRWWKLVLGKRLLTDLTTEEIARLQEIMSPEDWPIVQFALETGLRQSEQFKARWEWVDMERGILTIPHSKSGRTRHIPLSEGALSILKASRSWIDSPYLFPSPVTPNQPRNGDDFARRIFGEALKRGKIEGVTWHTLRHTFASRLVMAGVDIRTVQELMGHSTITMTMRYAHLSPNHLRDAVNKATLGQIGIRTVTKTVTEKKDKELQEVETLS